MKKIHLIILGVLIYLFVPKANAIDKAMLRWQNSKPVIDSIAIRGNEVFSDGEIKGKMYSKTNNFWRSIKNDRRSRLHKENLSRDTLEIKYLYLSNGYLGVKVREDFVRQEKDSSCLIWVNIHEGRQFIFDSSIVTGEFDGKFRWSIMKITRQLEPGKPANPLLVQKTIFDIKTYMANNGYPYAKVNYSIDTSTTDPRLDVTFKIDSDSLVYFGSISVEGFNNYSSNVGIRELKIKEGDIYKRETIIKSQKRLYESGYFTFAQLNPIPNQDNRLRPDFMLKVKERKPWFVSASTGAGQSDVKDLIWDLSFGIGKRNVNIFNPFHFGGSNRLNLLAEYSFSISQHSRLVEHRYRLRYTMPWFMDIIRMPVSLTFEYEPPIRFVPDIFTIQRYTLSLSTTFALSEEVKFNTGFEYQYVKITERVTDLEDEEFENIEAEEDLSPRRNIYTEFRFDSRDNIFIPERGALANLSIEYFGGFLGGDENFYRLKADWSTYQRVWPGWIYAIRLKGGYVTEFGNSDFVPSEERLYLGGANTIRGFVENSLGPQLSDGSAKGANVTFIFNQEFRWKTFQILNFIPFFKNFPQWQSVFFDVGNGYGDIGELKFNSLAYSYGTGFQIMSPAGPIRIDYARRISTPRYSSGSRWHFTILYAF